MIFVDIILLHFLQKGRMKIQFFVILIMIIIFVFMRFVHQRFSIVFVSDPLKYQFPLPFPLPISFPVYHFPCFLFASVLESKIDALMKRGYLYCRSVRLFTLMQIYPHLYLKALQLCFFSSILKEKSRQCE